MRWIAAVSSANKNGVEAANEYGLPVFLQVASEVIVVGSIRQSNVIIDGVQWQCTACFVSVLRYSFNLSHHFIIFNNFRMAMRSWNYQTTTLKLSRQPLDVICNTITNMAKEEQAIVKT